MKRFVALIAVVLLVATATGCSGKRLTLPAEKAEFAKIEIEKIAREYSPLADAAFADESASMQAQRAALLARLYTILEIITLDIQEDSRSGLVNALLRATLMLMGVPQ